LHMNRDLGVMSYGPSHVRFGDVRLRAFIGKQKCKDFVESN